MDFEINIPFQFDPTTHITYEDTLAVDLKNMLSTITDVVNIDTLSIYLDISKDKCPDSDMDLLRKQCPGLKKKELINKDGCYFDDDNDGVHNCIDQCPDTPAGVEVNSVGCPVDTITVSYTNQPSDTPIEN